MAEQNYSLLIAALVAVVAIVGLVLYANASSATVFRTSMSSPIVLGNQGELSASPSFYTMGKDVGAAHCAHHGSDRACCNDECTVACDGVGEYKISGRTVDDCFRNCRSGCGYVVDEYFTLG